MKFGISKISQMGIDAGSGKKGNKFILDDKLKGVMNFKIKEVKLNGKKKKIY